MCIVSTILLTIYSGDYALSKKKTTRDCPKTKSELNINVKFLLIIYKH